MKKIVLSLMLACIASMNLAAKIPPPPPVDHAERAAPPPKVVKHNEDATAKFELLWEVTGAVGYSMLGNVSPQIINTSKMDLEFEVAKYFKVAGGLHLGPKAHFAMSPAGFEDFSQWGFFAMAQQLVVLAPKGDPYTRHLVLGGGIGYMVSTLFYDANIPTIIIPIRYFQSWTAPALRFEAHYRHFFGGLTYLLPGGSGETAFKLSFGMGIY